MNHKFFFTVIGILLFVLLSIVPIHYKTGLTATVIYFLMSLMVMSAVLIDPVKVVGGKFISYIGRISYGIYLFHMLVINMCKKLPIFKENTLVLFLVASTFTVIVAAVSFHFFEKPILKYKNKFN
jgi:peptidoglycan/LPS O-acetylase OafA/YrhL